MASPMFVDATDLAHWADRRDAQDLLPKLIRWLVHATVDRVLRAGFPAGEGVQLGGWDGIVNVEKGNAFVPDGTSGWEMGVNKAVKAKADNDYNKRTFEPLGITPSQSTFVFVTPRRWGGKREWKNECRKDKRWRDVRAYDADDLEEWLDTAPAVHMRISVLLGKRPHGAQDLSTWWENWLAVTDPKLSAELVTAGRQAVIECVQGWLENPVAPLSLRGGSSEEAIAVFAAALQKLIPDRREHVLSRAILVQEPHSWNHLAVSDNRLVLVADFHCDSVVIGQAVRNGHSVILPLGHSDTATSNAVDIPRLSSEVVEEMLVASGVTEGRARDLAMLAKRSLTTFRRRLSIVPEIEQPAWARPENARSLLPALLAGRWSGDKEGDQQVLASLANKTYNEVSSELVRWSNENDPPIRCVGTTWYLTSEEDAWALLGRFLALTDLNRFQQIAVDVLGHSDPAFDLPDDERWMARVIGDQPRHSGLLRTGIANTLAILGARGSGIRITGGSTLERSAGRPVVKLLATSDWKVWASLPLELLAEAAPDEFLRAVERGVAGDKPFLLDLFRDKDTDSFSSAPHTSLLFALESLAWSEDYLARTAIVLAKLARLDPGGRWANRPIVSLRSIFLLWYPQTSVAFEKRFNTIDIIRQREPGVAWKVMASLLPCGRDHSLPIARPRWQEWAPTECARPTMIEFANGVNELIRRMLDDVGSEGPRWADLIGSMFRLSCDHYDAIVKKLESLVVDSMQPQDIIAVWNALRALLSWHRSHADAHWSLPKDELDHLAAVLMRFEPLDPLSRYGWLFSHKPSLPEGHDEDWEAYDRTVATRQRDAVEALFAERVLSWVTEFIQHVECPDQLGAAIARSSMADGVADDLLKEHLRPGESRHHAFVAGFVNTKVRIAGIDWVRQKLAVLGPAWSPAQRAALCTPLHFKSGILDIVQELDELAKSQYWKMVVPFNIDEKDVETVVRTLLANERAGVAVSLLGRHLRKFALPAGLVLEALEGFLRCPTIEEPGYSLSAHDIFDLLEFAAASDGVDETRVAKLELAFLPLLRRQSHSPKILLRELARSPEFFTQVVALVYRAEGEERQELSENDQARSKRAYELLQSWRWRPIPGHAESDAIDPHALRDWVIKVREILQSQRRLASGDTVIGEILSGSPDGEDGAWPHATIRDLIEELSSEDFERGLMIGLVNSEGVSWRNPNEGGTQERRTAERYKRFVSIVSNKWPRTAAMLRRIRDHYNARADDEDRDAELRDDLSR